MTDKCRFCTYDQFLITFMCQRFVIVFTYRFLELVDVFSLELDTSFVYIISLVFDNGIVSVLV